MPHLEPLVLEDGRVLAALGHGCTLTLGTKDVLHFMNPRAYPEDTAYTIHAVLPHHVTAFAAPSYEKLINKLYDCLKKDPSPSVHIANSPPAWKPGDWPFRTYNAMEAAAVSEEILNGVRDDLQLLFPNVSFILER